MTPARVTRQQLKREREREKGNEVAVAAGNISIGESSLFLPFAQHNPHFLSEAIKRKMDATRAKRDPRRM
jgi:hypothetical protein